MRNYEHCELVMCSQSAEWVFVANPPDSQCFVEDLGSRDVAVEIAGSTMKVSIGLLHFAGSKDRAAYVFEHTRILARKYYFQGPGYLSDCASLNVRSIRLGEKAYRVYSFNFSTPAVIHQSPIC